MLAYRSLVLHPPVMRRELLEILLIAAYLRSPRYYEVFL